MKLQLKKFDLRTMKDDAVVVLIGKRGSGKSEMVKAIMHEHQNLPIGVVISQTEQANHFFEEFVPKMMIYDEYDPAIIDKFLKRQMQITNQFNAEKKNYGRTDLDPRGFLILDDCLYDKTWPNDKNIRCLFMNGRHFKVFFIITMQYPLGIPPHLRCNVDYVFIFRETQLTNRERIFRQYAGMFPDFQTFNTVLDQTTEDFECLVIDNKVRSNKLEDQVYWCKAPLRGSFRVCCKELWDMQAIEEERRAMGMAEEPDDEEPYDPSYITKNKRAPKIKVHKGF